MCTALSIKTNNHKCFFGRNMDLAYFFNQSPICISRGYEYQDKVTGKTVQTQKALLGMGTIIDHHPAMAEAMNENGLACAGLNFARYAHYEPQPVDGKTNIAPYDFILWVLLNHDTVDEVIQGIANIQLVDVPINSKTPVPTLHWMISDKYGKSIVVEKTKEKLAVYPNPVGVMTNDPTFDWHLINLNEYMNLTPHHPDSVSWGEKELKGLGIGAGTLGMPGDFASVSRFVRIAYVRTHLPEIKDDATAVAQFFHMLDYVAMVKGSVMTEDGMEDMTLYASCMDQEKGIYYYKTYGNNRINAVKLSSENLDNGNIKVFDYLATQDINYQN